MLLREYMLWMITKYLFTDIYRILYFLNSVAVMIKNKRNNLKKIYLIGAYNCKSNENLEN